MVMEKARSLASGIVGLFVRPVVLGGRLYADPRVGRGRTAGEGSGPDHEMAGCADHLVPSP
jgi:hypothetical protein